jgi:hypothetical protein
MNTLSPMDSPLLPLSLARHVDAVCHRFETAWKSAGLAGARPAIEAYLGDTPEPARAALLCELILVEVYHRRRAGEDPQAADYLARFPELVPGWLSRALAACPDVSSPTGPAPGAVSTIAPGPPPGGVVCGP